MSTLQSLWTYFSTLKPASIAQLQLQSFYFFRDIKYTEGFDTASSGFIISMNGAVIEFSSQFGDIFQGTWVEPTTAAPGSYQARVTNVVGDPLATYSSPTNTWINISQGPTSWYIEQIGSGYSSCSFTIELGTNQTAIVSANVQLEAVVSDSRGGGIEP